MKLWTVTIEGRRRPILRLEHDGREAVATVERTIARAKAAGFTVIVGLVTTRRRITVEEIPNV